MDGSVVDHTVLRKYLIVFSSKMLKSFFFLLFSLAVCAIAWGSPGGQGFGGSPQRGFQGGQYGGGQGYQGGQHGGVQGFDGLGRNGRQNGGQGGKYGSNFYNDKDVYGYDAKYPFGEASHINYKSKDARARRGPEFAKTSRAYSRNGGAGGQGGHGGQEGWGNQGGYGQKYGGGNW